MTNSATLHATKTDLQLLSNYKAREIESINKSNESEWGKRTKLIAANNKYNVIEEALIGLNQLNIRPNVSILKIIEGF